MELFALEAALSLDTRDFDAGLDAAGARFADFTDRLTGLDRTIAEAGIGAGLAATLADAMAVAGRDAGDVLASTIQRRLNRYDFGVSVTGYLADVVGRGRVQRNASAMSSGRIFNRPTVFDYADGAYQVAGDAGSEAVVGTNSLQRMIASAVRGAMGGQEIAVPRDSGRDMTIILELDRQQFAKAVYRSNNEETQRVGVRMGTGGAY